MGGSIEHTALETLKGVVGKVAPVLGTVLGSPLAGVGINLLANIFHADSENLDDLLQKITTDPEAAAKILQLQNQHGEMLAQIAAQNYATEVNDRISARKREVDLKDWVPTILAIGFLINYAAIQFYCVTHPSSAIDVISARFQDVLIMIMSYYFGSAHKSAK